MTNAIRVLLVEDDEEDKFLTTELLRDVARTEYQICWVKNATDAIREIRSGAHDVALLDYRLGADTALDVLIAVRDVVSTPCVVLTGQYDHDRDFAASEAGAVDFLLKGDLSSDLLERSIRYAIGRSASLQSLRDSQLRFRIVVESATDAILLLDDRSNILTWNESALRLFDRTATELGGRGLRDITTWNGSIAELENSRSSDLYGVRPDGTTFPIEASVSHGETKDGRLWSAIIRDVTKQRLLEERLIHQAFHDPLTKLANRALFINRVGHAIVRLQRRPGLVSVLFLDLDDFKKTNDTLGHAAGDALLTEIADRLLGCVRTNDTVARLGGDEFAVLVEDTTDPTTPGVVAGRVMRALSTPVLVDGHEIVVNCSIGIAATTSDSTAGSDLLRDADVAMYAAKSRGKNCVEVFADHMHAAVLDRVNIEHELRRAIVNNEIIAHYQPILSLDTGRISGFEALARWAHPERGLLSPAVFIDIAEQSGLIIPIGESILRDACAQIRKWNDMQPGSTPLTMSVNLSNCQIENASIVGTVQAALAETGAEPEWLVLELTESLMINRAGDSPVRLDTIAGLGVRIAIDDFGTGYSSLSYLQDLPLSVLKVDRSFISRIDDVRGRALVESIVSMSHSLGLSTVAEGVERVEQLEALNTFGCAYGQGYLFARPVAAVDIDRLLAKQIREAAPPAV